MGGVPVPRHGRAVPGPVRRAVRPRPGPFLVAAGARRSSRRGRRPWSRSSASRAASCSSGGGRPSGSLLGRADAGVTPGRTTSTSSTTCWCRGCCRDRRRAWPSTARQRAGAAARRAPRWTGRGRVAGGGRGRARGRVIVRTPAGRTAAATGRRRRTSTMASPCCPQDAAILSFWGASPPLWHATLVEGLRPDLLVVDDTNIVYEGWGTRERGSTSLICERPCTSCAPTTRSSPRPARLRADRGVHGVRRPWHAERLADGAGLPRRGAAGSMSRGARPEGTEDRGRRVRPRGGAHGHSSGRDGSRTPRPAWPRSSAKLRPASRDAAAGRPSRPERHRRGVRPRRRQPAARRVAARGLPPAVAADLRLADDDRGRRARKRPDRTANIDFSGGSRPFIVAEVPADRRSPRADVAHDRGLVGGPRQPAVGGPDVPLARPLGAQAPVRGHRLGLRDRGRLLQVSSTSCSCPCS